MTNSITHILQQGEGLSVEFKSSFNNEAIESLVAFANSKGGAVYIGITNNGKISGTTINGESIINWINEIKNKTEPALIIDSEQITIENKQVVIFSIKEFPIKPVSVQGRCFKRVGNSNHLMNISEASDLYMQTMQYSWDSYPYQHATFDDLHTQKILDFIAKVNTFGRFKLDALPIDALTKLRMTHNGVPTNAAMILFSKQDLMFNVHIGRFKSPTLIIDDSMIRGNLYDVLDESMKTIVGHLKFAFEITGETTQRTEIPEYPLEAIRELLLNALVHRNYASTSDIQIKIFDQSISFSNPSGLYGDLKIEDLQTNTYQASTRNKLIAEAFYLTHDIEKYGSGFGRIRQAIAQYPTMKFGFQEIANGFRTELSYVIQKTSSKDLEKDLEKELSQKEIKIIEAIKQNPKVTQQLLSEQIGINPKNIRNYMKLLKQKGIIKRIGPDKGGFWEIQKHK